MIDMKSIDRLPSGAFRIRVTHLGEMLSGTAPTLELAVRLRDELKRQIVDGELVPTKGQNSVTLGPRFLGARTGNRDANNEASRWHKHVATAPWARLPVHAVGRHEALSWLKVLKRKRTSFDPETHGDRPSTPLGWQTRKHCVNLARAFFAWCLDQQLVTANPFADVHVEREDGDEDGGYQDTWHLDLDEQRRFLATWDSKDVELDATDRVEKWIVAFMMGTGLRKKEAWCLHLADVHVDGAEPHIVVRFGSWDAKKGRYRPPKGRKGEKKSRVVPLFGMALEAARAWLATLPTYAPKNPLGLMFPTERGARRWVAPRSWKRVVDTFGTVPRIGRKVWLHLLRHTCASSMVSGWWGLRWSLEDVCKVLGHTDVRTTQIYAHLAPAAVQETATRAQAAYLGSCHGAVTPQRPAARKPAESKRYARSDSNGRLPASKACKSVGFVEEIARHDNAVTAIRHVLEEIADGRILATSEQVAGLEVALDFALELYAQTAGADGGAANA